MATHSSILAWRIRWREEPGGLQFTELQSDMTESTAHACMAVCGGLTNSCERREVKGKGEKERYTHLNAEFQK